MKNYQSPPIAPSSGGGRRSTKKRTGRESNLGESSFERAPESEAGAAKAAAKGADDYSEDRSDLGFTDNDDEEPVPLKDSSKEGSQHKLAKIQVNDKTIFGPEGMPLSPKEITADSPHVKEGLSRLQHVCQINMIKHD